MENKIRIMEKKLIKMLIKQKKKYILQLQIVSLCLCITITIFVIFVTSLVYLGDGNIYSLYDLIIEY